MKQQKHNGVIFLSPGEEGWNLVIRFWVLPCFEVVWHVQHQRVPSCPAEFSSLLPENMTPKSHLAFRHVIPVSAANGFGIDHLKSRIRESLDEDAEKANEVMHVERLRALERYAHKRLWRTERTHFSTRCWMTWALWTCRKTKKLERR